MSTERRYIAIVLVALAVVIVTFALCSNTDESSAAFTELTDPIGGVKYGIEDSGDLPGAYVTGYDEEKLPENLAIPDKITSGGTDYNVVQINGSAFSGCTKLKGLTVGNNVTKIDHHAFAECTNLITVTIPNNVKDLEYSTFNGCTSLTSVTIGNGVTTIASEIFNGCTSLTSVTIPAGVTHIGSSAFEGCTSLTSVEIPASVTTISSSAFGGCTSLTSVEIPASVTTISSSAFGGCTSLTSVTIPAGVTDIYEGAFPACTNLTSIEVHPDNTRYKSVVGVLFNKDGTKLLQYPAGKPGSSYDIPDGVTDIGSHAFTGCVNLTSVTIPGSVTSLGYYEFYKCTSLTSVTIPSSVTSIGRSVFEECTSLTSVTIPVGVKTISSQAFLGCTSLTSVTIPDSVTSIENHAFSGCTSLTSVTIPDSITSIGDAAFYGCTSLTSVEIPASVATINSRAFGRCTSLTSVTIPGSVTSIGDAAFYECTSLTSVTIPSSVTSIDRVAFNECTNLTSLEVLGRIKTIGGESAFGGCTVERLVLTDGGTIDPSALNGTTINNLVLVDVGNTVGGQQIGWNFAVATNINRITFDTTLNVSVPATTETGKYVSFSQRTVNFADPSDMKDSLGNNITERAGKTFVSEGTAPNITWKVESGTVAMIPHPQIPYSVYDGNSHKGVPNGTGYTLSGHEETKAGEHTATATLETGYVWEDGTPDPQTIKWEILPAHISVSIIDSIPPQVQTGSAVEPALTIKFNSTDLVKDIDYTVVYANNINAGTATAVITGIGNFTGAKTVEFNIVPKRNLPAPGEIPGTTYNGSAQTPTLVIIDGATTLVEGTDYTMSPWSPDSVFINAGEYTVTLTGAGIYDGTHTVTYVISKVTLDKPTADPTPFLYDETEKEYKPGGFDATHMSITGNKRTVKGSQTVTVSLLDKANYEWADGTVDDVEFTFNIASEVLPAPEAISGVTYNGKAQPPKVVVKNGATTLVEDTHYKVSWSPNSEFINAGTYTATVAGIGDYTGTGTTTFEISPLSISGLEFGSIADQTHTGTAVEPDLTIKFGETTLVKGTDYTIGYTNNINIGTATATITGIGNYTGTKTTTFKISPMDISGLEFEPIVGQTHTGSEVRPYLTIKQGETTLVMGIDYTVDYANNIDVGIATVTVTGKGNYTGTETFSFNIVATDGSSSSEDGGSDGSSSTEDDSSDDGGISPIVLAGIVSIAAAGAGAAFLFLRAKK